MGNTILTLLDGNLIAKASTGESKVFYQKMKADYYRYIAEYTADDKKTKAANSAKEAYEEAQKVAEKDLAVTHPIRLGLALNFSVFQYEVCRFGSVVMDRVKAVYFAKLAEQAERYDEMA